MKIQDIGLVSLLFVAACDSGEPPLETDGTSSGAEGSGSMEDGAELARMMCEAASSASACDEVEVGSEFGCVWGEVRLYSTGSCEFETQRRCLALDAFRPGPPNCPPLAGCENPDEQPDSLLRPVFRTLADGTVEVVDTCAPYEPVGVEPAFVVCSDTEFADLESPCSCACSSQG
ncbi:MAG: hypothetical protein AAGA54_34085 [Myxococcota bacterium]